MAAFVVIDQRVQLRTDSPFAGQLPNPPAGAIGTVTLLDNDWVVVLWDGFTIEYNYRVEELDWYGDPPSNLDGWDWAQAFHDAKNQPISVILDRINPLSPNYDQSFDVMYNMFIQTKVVVDRMNVVQLIPVISSGDKYSVSWNDSSQFPSGTFSVSSVYNNDATYSCWKMIDSSLGTYWYPQSYQFRNSYWEVVLDSPCSFQKSEVSFSNGLYRPTQFKVEVSNNGTDYSVAGVFDIPRNNSNTLSVEVFTFPSIGFYTHIKFTCMDIVDPSVIGYAVFDFKLYGVRT